MDNSIEPVVVGVRFSKVGKVYHFAADTVTDVKVGDMVVVETARGWQLGQVAQLVQDPTPPPDGWKPIDRRATPRDLLMRQMWQMKESEVVSSCRERANQLKLAGIKIVSAEYSFDGSRLSILFSSETEEKYDLKSLRQDMQRMFAPSQVEMRQVGPRDVAKVMCGMGACGLETRCCCLFLTEFSSISIRMAKDQGISLTPTEITGMCGRLRCCLIYEYDTYVEARSKLPKRNKRVRTPQGDGKVVDVVPLREAVIVDLPEVGYREFPGKDVILLDADGQPVEQPVTATQQAPETDQSVLEEEAQQATSPVQEPSGEKPPKTEQPRPAPSHRPGGRPEHAQRSNRPDRPGRSGREGQGGRDQAGRGNMPRGGRPDRSGESEKAQTPDNRQQGGKGTGQRQQNRPQQNRPQDQSGAQGEQPKPDQPPGGQQKSRGGRGDNPNRGRRDSRRGKGQRRDNTDTENRS
jgi:cell fate regulator YaaT (PSP1 superfamily)